MVCGPVPATRKNAAGRCQAIGDRAMDGIIYLVGLIVVVMAILSVLGLR
jgi:hypothetical protein